MWQEWQMPRASGFRGASGNRKNCQGFEYPKMLSTGPCMQKLDYELGKPVVEVPHESNDCSYTYECTSSWWLLICSPFSKHRNRIADLLVPNGEAKTHLERPTFNDASRSFESPDTDELGALGVTWDGPVPQLLKKGTKRFWSPKFCDQQFQHGSNEVEFHSQFTEFMDNTRRNLCKLRLQWSMHFVHG